MLRSMLQQRADVRRALQAIDGELETEFASGRIWYESDLHQVVLSYLHRELVMKDGRWVVGSQHRFGSHKPDVVCYYRRQDSYAEFYEDSEKSVVAFLEIKFRADLKGDLEKLDELGDRCSALTWMIYGDHFREEIHSTWFAKQQERATQIEAWVNGNPSLRGRTILKCGEVKPEKSACGDALSALNGREAEFWIFQKRRR